MKMWTLLAGVLLIVFGIIRVGGGIMNQMSAKPKVTQMDMYVSIACLVVGVVLALISRGMKEKSA
jgi:formate hydrogenlyase subunit 3/multisubunit Na+/H+ antiporter MnhD subunit